MNLIDAQYLKEDDVFEVLKRDRPLFYGWLRWQASTVLAKGQDYGRPEDPLNNLRASENLGIKPSLGVALRLQDKFARFLNLVRNGSAAVEDETLEDTCLDIAVYCGLYVLLADEEKNA